jgi:copper chaperone CopZ
MLNRYTLSLIVVILLFACAREEEKVLTIQVKELICQDGRNLVESQLLNLDGLRYVAANSDNGEVTVRYRTKLVEEETLRNVLKEIGFTVDGEPGDQNARRRLPGCCLASDAEEANND